MRQLPERELESLIERLKIRVDEAKRIDVPSQVARVLLQLPELRDPAVLPGPTPDFEVPALEPPEGAVVVEGLFCAKAPVARKAPATRAARV